MASLAQSTRALGRLARSHSRSFASVVSASSEASSAVGGSTSRKWTRPIPPGVEAAYDEALALIARDQQAKRAQLEELKKRRESEKAVQDADVSRQIAKLEIAAEINDPEVRWNFENGIADLSKPVYRYLREQAWRKRGPLDKLIERISLMKVVPDVIPSAAPTVDLQVSYGEGSGFGDHGGEGGEVLAGVFLSPASTMSPPTLSMTPFHTDERLYTLVMVDPDVPDETRMSFKTVCHWLVTDIPLSATRTALDPSASRTLLSYLSPHPQEGTPYHRYTFVLLAQPGPSSSASTGGTTDEGQVARDRFDVRSFAKERGLEVAGVHFFREVWSEEAKDVVSSLYRDVLGQPEPRYGKPPKIDRYRWQTGEKESRYF